VQRHAVVETGDTMTRPLQRSRVRIDLATLLGGEDFADPLQSYPAKTSCCHAGEPLELAGSTV
jgi:hypothetical protein